MKIENKIKNYLEEFDAVDLWKRKIEKGYHKKPKRKKKDPTEYLNTRFDKEQAIDKNNKDEKMNEDDSWDTIVIANVKDKEEIGRALRNENIYYNYKTRPNFSFEVWYRTSDAKKVEKILSKFKQVPYKE